MAEAAKTHESEVVSPQDRLLTEVDHFIAHRRPDGTYDPQFLADIHPQLRTAVQEAAMPYAVSRTEHDAAIDQERQKRTFMWLGKSALHAAQTGYSFHQHPEAIKRVDVEVDEALHAEDDLRPGIMKIFISPRMTRKDATYKEARHEHLADDDAVRASWLELDEQGDVKKRVLTSVLVRDIPLDAWVQMLSSPQNIFGKSIAIDDPDSALSVMKIHRQLELPLGQLPEGPVGVIEAVIPYISDPVLRKKVHEQLALFRMDQMEMEQRASVVATRWMKFEQQLAESRIANRATSEIKGFIAGLQHQWDDETLAILEAHRLPNTFEFRMTRQLESILEAAKRNTLWNATAVVSNNHQIIRQVDPQVLQEIRTNEALIYMAIQNGWEYRHLEADNERLVAAQNIESGGGCTGSLKANFRDQPDLDGPVLEAIQEQNQSQEQSMDKTKWKWKKGVCAVPQCSTRPGKTLVGPCSVCKGCQKVYDQGGDPTKVPDKPNKATESRYEIVSTPTENFMKKSGSQILELV